MTLSKALMRDDAAARWMRRLAPLLLLLGLLAAVLAPGMLNELRSNGAPADAASVRIVVPTPEGQRSAPNIYARDELMRMQ